MDRRAAVAVLMACHNRRARTAECLTALFAQEVVGVDIKVSLVDDGSTDGTAEMVAESFPDVRVLAGDGSLFWAAAMAMAELSAATDRPDYYLWLNDDTILDANCLATMLAVSAAHPQAIVAAATRDPKTGEMTYGGRRRLGGHPQRLRLVPPRPQPQACDTFNGNCVLVPRGAHDRVGPIDGQFPHAYADDDYGLRARRAGIQILQAPGTLATCAANQPRPLPRGIRARWRHLQSPKGLPVTAQVRYLRRHGGWRWPVWLVAGIARRVTRQ